MIGLSFVYCVRAIADGTVEMTNVEKIVAGTSARTDAAWDSVIAAYQASVWGFNPEKCEEIARQLLSKGRVEQPKLENDRHVPLASEYMLWVETEDQIPWADAQNAQT